MRHRCFVTSSVLHLDSIRLQKGSIAESLLQSFVQHHEEKQTKKMLQQILNSSLDSNINGRGNEVQVEGRPGEMQVGRIE